MSLPSTLAGIRGILLVDDDEALLRSTARGLRRRWVVRIARDREQALASVQRDPIDLAFVDLMMGGVSGIDVIRELKQAQPSLTAILVSGYASMSVAVEAAQAGAADVRCKPVDFRALAEAFETTGTRLPRPRQVPSLLEMEQEYIRRVLDDCNGNRARAATLLGISRSSLYRKVGPPPKR